MKKIKTFSKINLNNNEEILERELSISVHHDYKLWEKKYKAKACKLLAEKGDFTDLILDSEQKEINKIILEKYNIFDNPTYVYFKGNPTIHFIDGQSISICFENQIAISSLSLKKNPKN